MHQGRTLISLVALLVLVFALTPEVVAQEDQPTLFLTSECMKSKTTDYVSVETDIWQPAHQALVNQGKKNSWALYWVRFGDRSECDYYTINTYLGEDQLNDPTPYEEVLASVHRGKDMAKLMSQTAASRDLKRSELWTMVDSVPPEDFELITVNWMYTEEPSEYVEMEREIYKPVHQRLFDMGLRKGWAVYSLESPWGSSVPYNYATVDFSDKLGGVPWAAAIRAAHPDMELSAISQETEEIREIVRSEVWVLVAQTTPAP